MRTLSALDELCIRWMRVRKLMASIINPMRNSPSSTKITALAVATFLAASINTTAEGKPNKEHREEEQQAAFCPM